MLCNSCAVKTLLFAFWSRVTLSFVTPDFNERFSKFSQEVLITSVVVCLRVSVQCYQEDDGGRSNQCHGGGELPQVAATVTSCCLVSIFDQAQLPDTPFSHLRAHFDHCLHHHVLHHYLHKVLGHLCASKDAVNECVCEHSRHTLRPQEFL